jgi:hypothetical protein
VGLQKDCYGRLSYQLSAAVEQPDMLALRKTIRYNSLRHVLLLRLLLQLLVHVSSVQDE